MTNIGLEIEPPERTCEDPHCPYHGQLSVRGQVLQGRLEALRMERTAVVKRERMWRLPKYERYEKRTSRYPAHVPPCLDVEIGDHVMLAECRPLSKTVSFVIVHARRGKLEVRGEDVGAIDLSEGVDEDEPDEDGEPGDEAPTDEPSPEEALE